jgi:hypothetical protein
MCVNAPIVLANKWRRHQIPNARHAPLHLFFLRCARLYVALHSSGVRWNLFFQTGEIMDPLFLFTSPMPGGKWRKHDNSLAHSEVSVSKCFIMYWKQNQTCVFTYIWLCVTFNLHILLADHLVPLLYSLYITVIKLTHNKEAMSSIQTYPCSVSVLRPSFTTYYVLG